MKYVFDTFTVVGTLLVNYGNEVKRQKRVEGRLKGEIYPKGRSIPGGKTKIGPLA